MKIKESDGKYFDHNTGKREPVYCPCNGIDCPYYEKGICYIKDPIGDCYDWALFWGGKTSRSCGTLTNS